MKADYNPQTLPSTAKASRQPKSLKATPLGEADAAQESIKKQKSRVVVPEYTLRPSDPLFVAAYKAYYNGCTCGTQYDNNCAHYLSNAFLRADPNVNFPASAAKCPHGRMIRAKEFMEWVRSYHTSFSAGHNGLNYGYWVVYQESGGQGHVCIHKHDGAFGYAGTGDYPSWPVQWHYFY